MYAGLAANIEAALYFKRDFHFSPCIYVSASILYYTLLFIDNLQLKILRKCFDDHEVAFKGILACIIR